MADSFCIVAKDAPSQGLKVSIRNVFWENMASRTDGPTVRAHDRHVPLILDESQAEEPHNHDEEDEQSYII